MDKKNDEGKPFMDSIFGKILIGFICVIIGAVMYLGWVNSGSNDGNFWGIAFRLPFETKDHYCWRKSVRILTSDTNTYRTCMMED